MKPTLDVRNEALSKRPERKAIDFALPGFGPEIRIPTSFGQVPAKLLNEHDKIRIADGSVRIIKWMRRVHLDEDFLDRHPSSFPVVIQPGAFRKGVPSQELALSPGQSVDLHGLVPNGELKPAALLDGRPRIQRRPTRDITYTIFHCGEPCNIAVDGLLLRLEPLRKQDRNPD